MSNFFSRTSWISQAGIALIAVSVFVLGLTWYPLIKEEWHYAAIKNETVPVIMTEAEAEEGSATAEEVLIPVDEEFGIIIPKIRANAAVVPDVDWRDGAAYQRALTKGVAHAAGTSYPGEPGNVFLFAHSGIDFYEAARYNAVFYLIGKLEAGDEITLLYHKKKFHYRITEKKIVAPEAVEYLAGDESAETLTLMTCSPPGTTLRRLIVKAVALSST